MSGIILTGAGGQLGKAFLDLLSFEKGYNLYSFDRGQFDIADEEKVKGVLDTVPNVQYWINCAAYTKVDDAESHEADAERYNSIAPAYIASACKAHNIHLFHFSSDYVYDNGLNRPLLETDPTDPKSIYAQTKLRGELAIQREGGSYTILRTSWVFGPGGHNFVNTMLRLANEKSELRIVGDQLGAPTYTYDIVLACQKLIEIQSQQDLPLITGIFNFANAGEVTWDDFARTIFQKSGLVCKVKTITTSDYAAPAPRPAYSVLNCDKIKTLINAPIPTWEDALTRYLAKIKSS